MIKNIISIRIVSKPANINLSNIQNMPVKIDMATPKTPDIVKILLQINYLSLYFISTIFSRQSDFIRADMLLTIISENCAFLA